MWGVTRIDENGPPIGVGTVARGQLAAALDRDGVVAAMLFGSQATGKAGPLDEGDTRLPGHQAAT